MLSSLSKSLSYLALDDMGGAGLDFVIFLALFVASKLLVAGYLTVGIKGIKDNSVPHWMLQVRFSVRLDS